MAGHSRNIDEYVAAKWLGLAGAAAGVVGLIPLWDTRYRYWVIAIAVVFGSILVWSQLIRGRLSIFSSGLVSFVADFKENKNAEVFATITQNYDYLGYSFDTVSKPFEIWFRDDRKGNLTIRILLADPAWDGLDFQSRFDPWRGITLEKSRDYYKFTGEAVPPARQRYYARSVASRKAA